MCAGQEAAKSELALPIFRPIMTVQYILHLFKQNRADKRLVRSAVLGPFPLKKPQIKPMFQEFMQVPFCVLLSVPFE